MHAGGVGVEKNRWRTHEDETVQVADPNTKDVKIKYKISFILSNTLHKPQAQYVGLICDKGCTEYSVDVTMPQN
uniref:Uncharacterized protein n=1 Tax=Strigamia maritima TaxID=126957 RepID=T1JEK1_STRMM